MTVWARAQNMMMRHGKHRGHSFAEVAQMDRSYCSWVLRSELGTFTNFHKYLRKTHGGILDIGHHKGMFFDELFASQQDYCRWVMNLEDPGAGFHKLIDWLKKKHSQEEPPTAMRENRLQQDQPPRSSKVKSARSATTRSLILFSFRAATWQPALPAQTSSRHAPSVRSCA